MSIGTPVGKAAAPPPAGKSLLDEREKQRLVVRKQLGKAYAWLTFSTVALALAFIALLFYDVVTDVFSWQVVEPANSGRTFAWSRAPLGGERVIRLELLEAQVALGELEPAEAREQVNAFLNDPEEKRLFNARNRVELMWYTEDGPFRWVVTNSRDNHEADIGLLGINAYLRRLRDGLAEDAEVLEPQRQALLTRLQNTDLDRGFGFANLDLLRASLEEGQTLYLNPWLDASFFTQNASRTPTVAGLRTALAGTLWVTLLVILMSVPIGVGASLYLEEYAPNNRFTRFIEVNIRNLAGVPSIIYGILGLYVFVRLFNFGPSILPAALTLSLLVLPVIIITGREAVRAVPSSLRQASYGLGATKWQTVSQVVLPNAITGIVTGVILAIARAIGETAPLLLIGAAAYVPFLPSSVFDPYTVIPVQIYSWIAENNPEFRRVASAGIVTLLSLLIVLYSLAFYIRRRFERSW
jgi:phosphate transport system permease protein